MTMATSLPLLVSPNQQSTKRWVPERDDDDSGDMREREEEEEVGRGARRSPTMTMMAEAEGGRHNNRLPPIQPRPR